ncbi:MAG: tRNA (N6-threonylcarbamoyladenosine(37)-N6)-methyltransferase TrmO [Deltaproteobacteria bacterium]|nr:tRNA (N6-threonylcarbamoyladenosine(37)-N6)-methyltransferase TrmO [Deltaproteobacteria bacterium]
MNQKEEPDDHTHKEIVIRPVGYIISDLKIPSLKAKGVDIEHEKDPEQTARDVKVLRDHVSELIINPELVRLLDGLEDFSHALVLYWPHLLPPEGRSITKVHPMGNKEFPLVGVFSTCSPARPNPVLLTVVKVIERKENILRVKDLDAVDGSPIIDIKPYTKHFCPVEDITVSDWMKKIQEVLSPT